MAESSFDIVVIGSGPGGYVSAIRAGQLGLSVACIEESDLGGVCLNIGCIPTKALLTSAHLVNATKDAAKHGISFSDASYDFGPAQERSRAVAGQLSKGVAFLFKKNKVTHVKGRGRLLGDGKVEVTDGDGSTQVVTAKSIVIATGSRPRNLPILPIDEDRIWSSTGALFQKSAPASVAVVGAGAVGMEFADVFSAYGSQVTVLEGLERVLPLEDEETSKFMARVFKKKGIEVFTSAMVEGSEVTESGVTIRFTDKAGKAQTLMVEYVLSAIGRVPNIEDLGLEVAGVKLDESGFIQVDDHLRTSVEGVYAIGDVAGHQLLAHKASHEGIVAAETIAGVGHHAVDYGNVPNCTYCEPEVASVGLTEAQAKEQGLDFEVGKFPWVGNGRALAGGHADGFVKVIRGKEYSEILGAHIVGPNATELIAEFVVGRHLESTVEEMEVAMHPHPTLSEAVAEASLSALGRAIHI